MEDIEFGRCCWKILKSNLLFGDIQIDKHCRKMRSNTIRFVFLWGNHMLTRSRRVSEIYIEQGSGDTGNENGEFEALLRQAPRT